MSLERHEIEEINDSESEYVETVKDPVNKIVFLLRT